MDEIGEFLRRVRDQIRPSGELYAGHLVRRERHQRAQRMSALALGVGIFAVLVGGLVWGLVNEGPQSSIPGAGENPSGQAPSESPSERETCVFPPYRPSYLPWLDAHEDIPRPEFDRIPADSYGSPSYATLLWKYGNVRYEGGRELKGTVVLWRTTEPATPQPINPAVPALPGGSSEGALNTPPGQDDWAVVWLDSAAAEYGDVCGYTTLVVSLPNLPTDRVREEALRVAGSLVRVTS